MCVKCIANDFLFSIFFLGKMSDPPPGFVREPKRTDPAWAYCHVVPDKPRATQCKFCLRVFQGGGITRLKNHLGTGKDVEHCTKQGKEVRQMFQAMLRENKQKKLDKASAKQRYEDNMAGIFVDSEEEEELDNMGFRVSDIDRARELSHDMSEAEQLRRYHGSQLSRGGSVSGSTTDRKGKGKISNFFRSSSTRVPDIEVVDVDTFRRGNTGQKSIKEAFSKKTKAAGDHFRHLWVKMALWGGINANQLSNNPFTQSAIDAAVQAGQGVRVPSAHSMYGSGLTGVVADVEAYIERQRIKWEQYGVTVMCDGWTGPTRKSLMNFMAYCDGNCCFIGSVDITKDYKNYKCIMKHLKNAIDWVGKECVVQVVTDNGPNYKKAGETLSRAEGKYFI